MASPERDQRTSTTERALRRRWWAFAVAGLAQLMVTVDITIVNIALPSAQQALGFSDAARQWVVTGYALAFGSLLLISGRLTDLFGRRITMLLGVIIFGAGSALGGAAPDFTFLIIARVVQGVGGALLAPAALATLTALFTTSRERARAFGIFGAIGVVGGALGLLLGGVLTQNLDWRWTLYVNFGIALVALVGVLVFFERDRDRTTRPQLDLLGAALVTAGLVALVFGLSNAQTYGWSSVGTWGVLALSVVLLGTFGWWQTRAAVPLLPLRIFRDRDRGASFSALLLVNIGSFAVALYVTYYLQLSLGYTPIQTGLAFLPLIVGTVAAALFGSNVLLRLLGPRVLIPGGMLIAAGSLVWLAQLDQISSYWTAVLPPLLLFGAGLGLVMPPATNVATYRVSPNDAGAASAAVNTTQQIGGSIGLALLSTLAASAATGYIAGQAAGGAEVAAQAALHSYAFAYWVTAAIFTAGAVFTALLYRSGNAAAAVAHEATLVA